MPWNGIVISFLQSFVCDWTKLPSPLLQLWAELTLISPLAFYHFCFPFPLPISHLWLSLPVESHTPISCLLKLTFRFVFLANRIHLSSCILLVEQSKVVWEEGEREVLVAERDWQPLSAKATKGLQGNSHYWPVTHTPILSLGQLPRSWLVGPSSGGL